MTEQTLESKDKTASFIPDLRQGMLLAGVLAGLILAAMVSIQWVQYTVHRYHPFVFEDDARKALEDGDFGLAVDICTGNLLYAGNQFRSHGLVHLLRAKAYFSEGSFSKALDDLAEADTYWRNSFRNAREADRQEIKDFATEMGRTCLATGDAAQALSLFSLAGSGSGEALAYLEGLRASLSAAEAASLWPGGEYLIVRDFAHPRYALFQTWTERTGRTVDMGPTSIVLSPPLPVMQAARIAANRAPKEGMSWYSTPFYMRIPERPCRFRATILVKSGPPPRLLLGHFYPETGLGGTTTGEAPFLLSDEDYAVEAVLPGRGAGEPAGYIVRVGFALPRDECEYVIKRIDLLPGDGKESRTDG
ncbi:MAG TPA: hypothetical protein PKJ78_16425 [Candidatus Hydrogenedentes bacterium]|nr:hypothetical protein [Candidatus Hydrogenedentota bacterium]